MSKPIIECLKEYFEAFPNLGELATVNVDFLDKNAGSFSIEESPAASVIRKFVDGSRECQFVFLFAGRSFYAVDTNRQNIDNLHLFDQLREWLDENDRGGIFPDLGEKREVISLTATTSGYLFGVAEGKRTARYQIQCKLTYKEN